METNLASQLASKAPETQGQLCPAKVEAYRKKLESAGDTEYVNLGNLSLASFGCTCTLGPQKRF